MDIKKLIKKTLCQTCIIFTLITVLYSMTVLFLNVEADEILLDGTRVLLFLFFSFLVAFANTVLSVRALPSWARYLIHFVLCAFAFYLCVLLPVAEGQTPGFTVVGMAMFCVLYIICAGAIAFFSARYKRLGEADEPYTKRFSK